MNSRWDIRSGRILGHVPYRFKSVTDLLRIPSWEGASEFSHVTGDLKFLQSKAQELFGAVPDSGLQLGNFLPPSPPSPSPPPPLPLPSPPPLPPDTDSTGSKSTISTAPTPSPQVEYTTRPQRPPPLSSPDQVRIESDSDPVLTPPTGTTKDRLHPLNWSQNSLHPLSPSVLDQYPSWHRYRTVVAVSSNHFHNLVGNQPIREWMLQLSKDSLDTESDPVQI
jgi:hypothetical protein